VQLRLGVDVRAGGGQVERQLFATQAHSDWPAKPAELSEHSTRFRDETRRSRFVISIGRDFRLMVLGGDVTGPLNCKIETLVGRRLVARVPRLLEPETCVRVDCGDDLILGHVLGSWEERSALFSAIELREALVGLQELAESQCVQDFRSHPEVELKRGA
jgi:hypothetical protein